MARSNGPFGPGAARAPLRRLPADDGYGAPAGGQAPAQWPPQALPDGGHPAQPRQGYHFPPPEQDPNYGYNQQLLPQQWSPQGDQPRAYDLGNYPPGGGHAYSDPGPFQQVSHQQHQPYADADADYRDEFMEDEEPRRGKRWIFIVAALVGAIGVGGALAYTYRSLIPAPGRVPLVKADSPAKVKAGKERPSADKKEAATKTPPPQSQEEAAGEEKNLGPRQVRTVKIGPDAPPQVQPPQIPGIVLQHTEQPPPRQEPRTVQPPARVVSPPPQADEEPPPPVKKSPAQTEEEPPPQPVKKQAALIPPPKAPPAKAKDPPAASGGMGWVAVVSSQKSSVDALKVYADLKEKHGDVLASRPLDVQEADLTARGKGIWYRLVLGPPGSKEAALALCGQLKPTVPDCWAKEY